MLEKLQEILGNEFLIEETVIRKNNCIVNGISIRRKEEAVAKVFYCDSFSSAEELAKAYLEITENVDASDYLKKILDPCWVKENVYLRLTADVDFAKEYVHKQVQDLYIIPYVKFDEEHLMNLKVSNLKGYDKDEIFSLALQNMEKRSLLASVEDIIFRSLTGDFEVANYMKESNPELEEKLRQGSMLCLTNSEYRFGAASIFCESVKKRLCEIFTDGCYLIPSSVHEFLVVKKEVATPEDLKTMILEVNTTEVAKEDRLSDAAYFFDKGSFYKTL